MSDTIPIITTMNSETKLANAHEPPLIIGPREQIFHLLAEASEIEHTLMCSYLYAALSLKRGLEGGLLTAEAKLVAQWRKDILAVATEEMVHLLLVCNLSIALGGRPHLGRPNFPVARGYFPSGVVVKLSPFSHDTLDHFIFLERPAGVAIVDGAGFESDDEYEREVEFVGLMPSAQDYSTVGRLYEALQENLTAAAARQGEKTLFVGPLSAQIGPESIELPGVQTIVDLKSALLAIDSIVEQGEGSAGHREDSHYKRFLKIKNEYVKASQKNPAFAPAWPVATSPVMRRPPDPEGKVYVDNPEAAQVLDFANALYCQLLRCLSQAFGRLGDGAGATKKRYLDAAIELMHLLALAGEVLVTMPATEAQDVNAGVSFTMLRSVEPFFGGAAENQIVAERLAELSAGAEQLARSISSLVGAKGKIDAIADKLNPQSDHRTGRT